VVLDEAHTIKSSKSQISMAAAALVADRRWCLTGTPIQVCSYFINPNPDLMDPNIPSLFQSQQIKGVCLIIKK
jgi:hypothetical protein